MPKKSVRKNRAPKIKCTTLLPDIELYYRRLVRKFGSSPKADGYSNELARWARYRMYRKHLNLHQSTILDVGCGTGEFLRWLVGVGVIPTRYVGIDMIPEKIKATEEEYRKTGFLKECEERGIDVRFKAGLIEEVDDLFNNVIACSIFDVKQTDAPTTFRLACNTLAAMWARSTVAVGADFFSPYALDIQPFNAPIASEWLLPWVRANLGQRMLMDYTYLPHDYSIIVYREECEFVTEWKKRGGWKRETGGEE